MSETRQDPYSRVDYRRLIAWPQRIQREAAMLEQILGSGPSRRLLDLGCGTGEHSRFLVELGFEVLGVDRSEAMIEKALDTPVPPGLRFVRADLEQIGDRIDGVYGGAICLGNTLPHLRDRPALEGFLGGLRRRLEPGAPWLLQILNYDRIAQKQERYLPLSFRPDDDGELIFLRLMELGDDGEILFYPSTLRLRSGEDPPLELLRSKKVELRGWRREELAQALGEHGFSDREYFGSVEGGPFEPDESRDLIVVAR